MSASATPQSVAREIARISARNGGGRRVEQLQSLHDALTRFTAAEYGRPGSTDTFDDRALDESIAASGKVLRRLTLEQTWPMRRFNRRTAGPTTASKVWSR